MPLVRRAAPAAAEPVPEAGAAARSNAALVLLAWPRGQAAPGLLVAVQPLGPVSSQWREEQPLDVVAQQRVQPAVSK